MSHLEICKCGHDISTHHHDPGPRDVYACLGMYCDCPLFWDRNWAEPEPPPPVEEPPPTPRTRDSDHGWFYPPPDVFGPP